MNRWLTFVPALLCAGALVTAQTPAQEKPAGAPPPATQAPTTPPAAPAAAPAAAKVTYSGCLKPGTAPESWVLESAELSKPGSAPAVGTSVRENDLGAQRENGHRVEAARESQSRDHGYGGSSEGWRW